MFGGQTLSMGYVASSSQSAAPMATQGAKNGRPDAKETCVPATIRLIETAVAQRGSDGELRFHGSEAGMLLLVGCVETLVRQGSSLEMSLNDATGRIKARHYIQDASQTLEAVKPGAYISAFGSVREAPELHFAITGMRLIESADEVSYHMVEVAHAALKLQGLGQKQQAVAAVGVPSTSSVAADPATPAKPQQEKALLSPPKEEAAPAASLIGVAQMSMAVDSKPMAVATKLQGADLKSALLAYIQKEGEGNDAGLAISALYKHFASSSGDEVAGSLKGLVDDGELYNTIDDDHFGAI